ncbi:E3 ubiquitin-protein ligase RNF170 [Leptopilina boulardi]|uniref:E3 ubiquitin-protein ligase RNF170 n=1 Tax=Leptopilina boulardi TaxID=63433 RepID=UPI0021F5A9F2|nr:E3 ubiquitin-protein ligase RNF170 [Leptopilina boulardi]XP_051153159.1 E3 ubiquitin-protein ligase RNF170 [Leptopilina boulardi]
MNLSDYSGGNTLIMMLSQGEIPLVWKGYVTKMSIMAFALGTYFLFFRNREFNSLQNIFRKSKKIQTKKNECLQEKKTSKKSMIYNGELCPICLNGPQCGVRAYCGHLLCATCLESYCEAREVSTPPPCPLCRAPLDSVTLACEQQESTLSLSNYTKAEINPTEKTLAWIREYNRHRGQIIQKNYKYSKSYVKRIILCIVFLIVFTIITIIESKI